MIVSNDQNLGSVGDASSSVRTVGASLLTIAPATGPAAPFVAAAGLITTLVSGLFAPDLSKIAATKVVNDIEPLLQQNVNQWQGLDSSVKTRSLQAAYEDVFNQGWYGVEQGCQRVGGDAGSNCIGDRSRGGRWDWFSYYYDPIANDGQVHDDPTVSDTVGTSLSNLIPSFGSGGFDIKKLLVIGAVVGGGYLLLGGGRE